jgi:hypothetical protein
MQVFGDQLERSLFMDLASSLSDSLACCCMFDRCRCSSTAGGVNMKVFLKRAAALQIGCRIKWHVRHLEGIRNPTDAGPRRDERGEAKDLTGRCHGGVDRALVRAQHSPSRGREKDNCSHCVAKQSGVVSPTPTSLGITATHPTSASTKYPVVLTSSPSSPASVIA